MTATHFEQEMERIKEELLMMGGLVEEAVHESTQALARRDLEQARRVLRNDSRINVLENTIDAHCIRMIARHQPVAVDLRFLTAALRICAVLERIGDQAVNVSDRVLALGDMPPMEGMPPTLLEMCELARDMTRKCLDAFVRQDIPLAYQVCCQDDEMDDLNRRILEEMIEWMMKEQRLIRRGVEIILTGRHLERIADLATNVSEEVVFMVEGTVIRHQGLEAGGPAGRKDEETSRRY
ncbi:MAG: phosphate signaling complex protein PhoU [Thermodesulfobacteriota bacterium]